MSDFVVCNDRGVIEYEWNKTVGENGIVSWVSNLPCCQSTDDDPLRDDDDDQHTFVGNF